MNDLDDQTTDRPGSSPDAPPTPAHAPETTTHHFDVVSLIGGIVVLVLTVAFATGELDDFATQARVIWSTVLLGTGIGLLLTARRR